MDDLPSHRRLERVSTFHWLYLLAERKMLKRIWLSIVGEHIKIRSIRCRIGKRPTKSLLITSSIRADSKKKRNPILIMIIL